MSAPRRSRHRKAPTVARQLAMFAVFLGLMLAPVGINIATAYEYDAAQRLAQDDSSDMGDEGSEGEGEGDDQLDDPNAVQEDPNQGPTTATLILVSLNCPADGTVDPNTMDTNTLINTCPAGQATWDVSDDFGGYQMGTSNAPMTVAAGTVYITEQNFTGPDEATVACTTSFYGQFPAFTTGMGSTSLTADPGDTVTCAWVTMAAPAVATYIINVWECAAGYDPKAPNVDATMDCTQQAPNDIEFKLADTDPATEDLTQKTGQPYAGMVQFESVPAGIPFTLTETMPPTETRTFDDSFIWDCAVTDATGMSQWESQVSGMTPPIETVVNGTLQNLTFDAGTTVACEWFFVPTADPAAGDVPSGDETGEDEADTGDLPPVDGGSIDFAIKKYTCAADYDPFAAGADPDAGCQPTDGITFTLDGPDGSSQSTASGDPSAVTGIQVPSQAWFEGLAPGSYTITETVPDGFIGGITACEAGATITQYSDSGPNAIVDLASGPTTCDWINIPTGDAPADTADVQVDGELTDLTITKYTCPANWDYAAPGADLYADCATGPDGITFTATGPNDYSAQTNTGDSVANAVVFGGLEAGTYEISESVPDGTIAGVWQCDGAASYTGSDSAPAMTVEVTGGTVACDWVNIPSEDAAIVEGDPSDLLITKYSCPEGFDPFSVSADMLPASCSVGPDGITFSIAGPDGYADSLATGAASAGTGMQAPGLVAFEGLVPGSYTVTEAIPDGFIGGVVDCGGNASWVGSDSAPEMTIELSGGTVDCNWVNIATGDDVTTNDVPPTDQKYRVEVPKYTCPEGWDENDPNADYLIDCTPGPDGIEFTYNEPTLDVTLTALTGDTEPNVAIFTDLDVIWNDDGSWTTGYTITETVPEGYRYVGLECVDSPSDDPNLLGVGTCPALNIPVVAGELTIAKYTCPAGYDTTMGDPLADCWATEESIQFDLTGPDGFHQWQSTNDVIPGGVVFSQIPAGSYDLVETVPDGQFGGVWSCNEEAVYIPYTDSAGMTVEIGSAPVTCDWLNIPAEPVSLTITKYTCPVGYDTSSGDPLTDCGSTDEQIQFDLTGPNDFHQWQSTNDVIASGVIFENVGAGTYDITETTPPGTTGMIWNCSEGVDYTPSAAVAGAQITLTTTSGAVECSWVNIPTDGTITIFKYLCAEGYTPSNDDIDGQLANCTTPLDGITFTATPGNAGITDSTGQVVLTVPFGQEVTLTETVPTGYGEPLIYCGITGSDLNFMNPNGGASAALGPIVAGDSVTCEIINYVTPPTDLIISKWSCPEGYDPYASGANPYSDCQQGPNGVTFAATGPNGYFAQTKTGDSIDYAVMFGGLGAGDYQVSEIVPYGYIGLPWDCTEGVTWSAATEGVPSMLVSVTGGTVECDWLNIPTYQNEITVHKWICPDGADTTNRNYGWFEANCTASSNDIQFRLDHSAGSQYAYPENGTVFWKPVPGGPIGIQEYIPDAYVNPVVYCSVNEGPAEQFTVTGGYLTYNQFGADTNRSNSLECDWYNVYGGPGEITVYKWTCPANYDPYAYGANPYNDCTQGPNGVSFTAVGPSGYTNQTTTGASEQYAAVWSDLTPGNYTITEKIPTNVKSVYVWDCYGQRSGSLRPTPLSAKPTVTIKVQAGDEVVCHWLNVTKDTNGSLTVIKYTCTTVTWVSEVDCHTYEKGQSFSLVKFNGKSWDVVATNTTAKNGRYTWYGLQPGKYWLVELGGTWCHITSDKIDKGGQSVSVTTGTETVVRVYNCTTTPGKPGKPPVKYPNTGLPPAIREDWRLSA